MSITIKEIAAIAGVSRGTVDRVLHSRGNVNPEVAHRIREIAQTRGYKPNSVAKQLQARSLGLKLGFILPTVEGFWNDVFTGLKAACREMEQYGITVLIRYFREYTPEKQIELIDELLAENISGLAIVPNNSPILCRKLDSLASAGVPVVLTNSGLEGTQSPICYVGTDYEVCGRTAAGLLHLAFRRECAKLVIFTGNDRMMSHNLRVNSFLRELDCLGQAYDLRGIYKLYRQDQSQDRENTVNVAEAAFREHPDVNAVYTVAGAVYGVADVIEARHMNHQVVHIAFDVTPGDPERLNRGSLTALIGQEAFNQGYLPIRILFDYVVNDVQPRKRIITKSEIFIAQSFS